MASKSVYAIIQVLQELRPHVEELFDEEDRVEVASQVWLVRGAYSTTSDLARALGINKATRSGVVIRARYFSGAAHRDVVEKLTDWEE